MAVVLAACNHARPASERAQGAPDAGPPDPLQTPAAISEETHALLRAEGELLWTRWTTGAGPLPSSALAEHPRLARRESVEAGSPPAAQASGSHAAALKLLAHQRSTLALAREAR